MANETTETKITEEAQANVETDIKADAAETKAEAKKSVNPKHIRIISAIVAVIAVALNVLYTYSAVAKPNVQKMEAASGTDVVSGTDATSGTDLVISETDTEAEQSVSETDTEETEKEPIFGEVELPYYITVDKVGKIVSIYTLNEEGKYETLVRQCICATGKSVDKMPNGYYPLKNSKYKWNVVTANDEVMRVQYSTRISGDYLFHSVPYTEMEKDKLDLRQYKNLGKTNAGGYIWLTVECAKWIYDNCPAGTPVRIFEGSYDAELVEKLRPAEPTDRWDPTDPDNPNCIPQYDVSKEPKPVTEAMIYENAFEWAEECGWTK